MSYWEKPYYLLNDQTRIGYKATKRRKNLRFFNCIRSPFSSVTSSRPEWIKLTIIITLREGSPDISILRISKETSNIKKPNDTHVPSLPLLPRWWFANVCRVFCSSNVINFRRSLAHQSKYPLNYYQSVWWARDDESWGWWAGWRIVRGVAFFPLNKSP